MTAETLADLRHAVAVADALDRAAIGTAYAALVGYDPFADDPAMPTDDGADLLRGMVLEICAAGSLPLADVFGDMHRETLRARAVSARTREELDDVARDAAGLAWVDLPDDDEAAADSTDLETVRVLLLAELED